MCAASWRRRIRDSSSPLLWERRLAAMACAERTADWEASRSFAGMQLRQRWPAFEFAKVLKFQVREINCVADVDHRLVVTITVVNGAEAALLRAQVGEGAFVCVPELKRK